MEFERRRHSHHHIEIAPLVDVVFLLLLFFMLTSHLVQEPAVRIKLPESRTSEVKPETARTIWITKAEQIYFQDRPVELDRLVEALKKGSNGGRTGTVEDQVGPGGAGGLSDQGDRCRPSGRDQQFQYIDGKEVRVSKPNE